MTPAQILKAWLGGQCIRSIYLTSKMNNPRTGFTESDVEFALWGQVVLLKARRARASQRKRKARKK